jgi:hypothetical protein
MLNAIKARLNDLLTAPVGDDPRPSPVTGEAWMIAGVDRLQPSVSHVTHDDTDADRAPVVC